MAINAKGTVDVPLTLFGGLDNELSPPDLPEGVSPDCQDAMFAPGNVYQRWGLAKLYPGRPPATALWGMKYLQPNGRPLNLSLYSDGALEVEDVDGAPGAVYGLAGVAAGSFGKGCNAFGRAYIAFSDLKNGTDVPRQLTPEGYWDRITQDGPGAPPAAVADYTTSATITGIAATAVAISAIAAATDPGMATATVTVTTSTAHGLKLGETVEIVGVASAVYNGEYTVIGVPSATTFTVSLVFVPLVTNGSARSSNVAALGFATPHNLVVGDSILVSDSADASFNGIYAIASVPSTVQITYNNIGEDVSSGAGGAAVVPQAIESSSGGYAASNAVITLSAAPANVGPGDPVQITGSEASDSTFPYDSNVGGNPANWTILAVNGTAVTISLSGIAGLNGANNSTSGGTAVVGGFGSAGQYQCVQIFVTRNGTYTAPSAPLTFYSNGNAKFHVTGLAIGPPNVVARLLAFTAAGGGNFFVIPTARQISSAQPGQQPILVPATLVPDNTSTSVILNLADNETLAAEGIDIPGNDLFAQVTLAPCLGFFGYGSRLAAWGEWNKIQNLLNPSFDGGYSADAATIPLGWSQITSGGTLVTGAADFGFAWQITGDGGSGAVGQISQPAYQDAYLDPILAPITAYTFGAWIEASASGLAGSIICDLYSPTAGALATATIAANLAGPAGKFLYADFSALTPAVIPADTVLRIYTKGVTDGATVTIDEAMVIYASNPRVNGMRLSYVNNPEAFDGATGTLAPVDDRAAVQCAGEVRGSLYFSTLDSGLHGTTQQAGLEPSSWSVTTISRAVGALGPYAMDCGKQGSGDSGEEFLLLLASGGVFIFAGGGIEKISQEIQTTWVQRNAAAQQTMWVKSDTDMRRIYVGIPMNLATAPDVVLMLDRQLLESAAQIAASPPVHLSLTGNMFSSDITRKWCPWQVAANYGEMLAIAGHPDGVCFFGGNGQAPGVAPGFGNVYQLSALKLHDDDYGAISFYYTPYFFVSHEKAQQLQLSQHRNTYCYLSAAVSGVGLVTVTPLVNNLFNPWPPTPAYPLTRNPQADYEWGLNVTGNRCAPKFSVAPLPNTLDTFLSITKVVVSIRPDPVAPVRGALG